MTRAGHGPEKTPARLVSAVAAPIARKNAGACHMTRAGHGPEKARRVPYEPSPGTAPIRAVACRRARAGHDPENARHVP